MEGWREGYCFELGSGGAFWGHFLTGLSWIVPLSFPYGLYLVPDCLVAWKGRPISLPVVAWRVNLADRNWLQGSRIVGPPVAWIGCFIPKVLGVFYGDWPCHGGKDAGTIAAVDGGSFIGL